MRRGVALVGDERRRQRVHRLARKHDAARVHLRMTRKAVQESCRLNRRLVWLLVKRQVASFGTGAQQFDESRRLEAGSRLPRTAEAPREMFREPPHLVFRHAEHLRHVSEGAPRLEGREPAHHGAVLAAVLLEDELHHVVFAVVGEINVDVGQLVESHPLLVEEAPEIEAEADRTHVGNPEAIADQRIRRAAARDPFDAALAAGPAANPR